MPRQAPESAIEHRLLTRQVGSKQFGEISRVEIGEAIGGFLNGAFCFGEYTGRFLTQGAFVFADVRSVRGNIDEADDMRINAGLGDDGAAVTMADKDTWAGLKIEDPLRCSTSASNEVSGSCTMVTL